MNVVVEDILCNTVIVPNLQCFSEDSPIFESIVRVFIKE